jgi:hypothetical protein
MLPFGVAIALGIYTAWLKRQPSTHAQPQGIVKYGWAGALLSGAIGIVELLIYMSAGLSVSAFPDKILTFVSIGVITGIVAGQAITSFRLDNQVAEREQMVFETSWTQQSGPTPIVMSIIEAITAVEEKEHTAIDPLYDHIDTDVFTTLRSHDGSPWQFTLYTDDYEIRVSSHGTVTVYRCDPVSGSIPSLSFE